MLCSGLCSHINIKGIVVNFRVQCEHFLYTKTVKLKFLRPLFLGMYYFYKYFRKENLFYAAYSIRKKKNKLASLEYFDGWE